MRTAEDKCFCMKDLYQKYEKLEAFLKHSASFTQQCMDLKQKNNFILDQTEQLQAFLKVLEEVKLREKLLTFDPIADPFDKLNELK